MVLKISARGKRTRPGKRATDPPQKFPPVRDDDGALVARHAVQQAAGKLVGIHRPKRLEELADEFPLFRFGQRHQQDAVFATLQDRRADQWGQRE